MLQHACKAVHPPQSVLLQIRVKTLRRRARLLYLPAYVADYKFGEQFNAHGERRPQRFQAVVSGMDPASIAAERHYSPHKVLPLLYILGKAVTAMVSGMDPASIAAERHYGPHKVLPLLDH